MSPLRLAIFLCFPATCGLVTSVEAAADAAWGREVNALRTRLVADRAVYEAGQWVWLYLDVRNVSDHPVKVNVGEWMKRRIRLVGPDNKQVLVIETISDRDAWPSEVPPGKVLQARLAYERRTYGELPPGRYTAVWPQVNDAPPCRDPADTDSVVQDARVPPPSEPVEFEVRPGRWEKPAEPAVAAGTPWGKAVGGLCTRLAAAKTTFRAAHPIAMKLEIRNVGREVRHYHVPQVAINGWLLVTDARGKTVPYIGGSAQTWNLNPLPKLKPGETHVLDAFDLAAYYHLRRPGRYKTVYPGARAWGLDLGFPGLGAAPGPRDSDIPRSNVFAFEIVADSAGQADGDPAARLLPLLKERWQLDASPPLSGLVRPGRNWGRVPGRMISFTHLPTAYKRDAAGFLICLTQAKARPEAWHSSYGPAEYAGRVGQWHLYFRLSDRALERWPTLREDIRRALAKPPAAK